MSYIQRAVVPDPILRVQDATYILRSVVSHEGELGWSGHYVAVVKSGQMWWTCNDSTIALSTPEEIANGCRLRSAGHVYIAFYEKQ